MVRKYVASQTWHVVPDASCSHSPWIQIADASLIALMYMFFGSAPVTFLWILFVLNFP